MKPLSHKSRKTLFLFLTLVFIIVVPFLLATSFGYKIDQLSDVFKFIKTGGIYIHTNISNSNFYINDVFVKNNGLFSRNVLIQDLSPMKEYNIRIEKEGLHSWQKNLIVYPSIVTEARALMLPVEIQKNTLFPFIDENGVGTTTAPVVSKTPDLATTTILSKSNDLYEKNIALFKEDDTFKKTDNKINGDKDLEKENVRINETVTLPEYFIKLGITSLDELKNLKITGDIASWLENGNIIVNWTNSNRIPIYYFCLEQNYCRNQITIDWKDDILYFDYFPGRDDVFLVSVKSGIYAVEIDDRSDRNIQPVYIAENLDFRVDQRTNIIVKEGKLLHLLSF